MTERSNPRPQQPVTLVYLRSGDVLATLRPFTDWRAVQDAWPDSMTSLGPWSREDVVGFLRDDWDPDDATFAIVRLDSLLDGGDDPVSLVPGDPPA